MHPIFYKYTKRVVDLSTKATFFLQLNCVKTFTSLFKYSLYLYSSR